MIDDIKTGLVKLSGERFFSYRETNSIGNTLTKRTCCCFYARRVSVFGVARRFRMQLAKLLEIVNRHVITAQM